jgi:hypothetical protein
VPQPLAHRRRRDAGRGEDGQTELDAGGWPAELVADQLQVVQRMLVQPAPDDTHGQESQGEAAGWQGQGQPVA